MSNPLIQDREPPSSVEKKLPQEARRKLDHALRTMNGATYQDIFDQFQLAAQGISFSAFYRYARRRRAVARIADLAGEDSADGAKRTSRMQSRASSEAARRLATEDQPSHENLDSLESIISRRTEFDDIRLEHVAARYVCKYMIGLIHSGKASARQIERLANAYSKTASVQINRDRINAHIEHQRERIEIAHKSLQIRAEAVAARAKDAKPDGAKSKTNQHPDAPTADAPWGRKADGTPTTREEFLTRLDQAVADIYGLDLKYGPTPIVKRFPGDHLPPDQRTPENIAAGQRGLLPHELEGERKAKEDRVRRAEFDARRDAEEAASKAEEAARFAEEAQRRREEFERQVARGAAAIEANKPPASCDSASPGDDISPASPDANEPAASTNSAKYHPDPSPSCHSGGTLNLAGECAKESSADGGMRTARTEVRGSSGAGTEAQRQAKLRADRRAEWEEKHKKEFPAPQKCERPDTLDDLLKPKDRTCDLPNFCVDWKHK
ncbi:MAG: hypothetical protein HS101_14760 [Planctomycetia bacterium]|nr:hypothetical protein [Planctomycetia bacterium]MCC7313176.1 hypothetical protein [Planctomycetota bacterium]OQZ05356.1 MAG: hypothetical protein B6D36_10570 [Planctomycetes bacterium UTPLA1]